VTDGRTGTGTGETYSVDYVISAHTRHHVLDVIVILVKCLSYSGCCVQDTGVRMGVRRSPGLLAWYALEHSRSAVDPFKLGLTTPGPSNVRPGVSNHAHYYLPLLDVASAPTPVPGIFSS
jgi:hypothetical protein